MLKPFFSHFPPPSSLCTITLSCFISCPLFILLPLQPTPFFYSFAEPLSFSLLSCHPSSNLCTPHRRPPPTSSQAFAVEEARSGHWCTNWEQHLQFYLALLLIAASIEATHLRMRNRWMDGIEGKRRRRWWTGIGVWGCFVEALNEKFLRADPSTDRVWDWAPKPSWLIHIPQDPGLNSLLH